MSMANVRLPVVAGFTDLYLYENKHVMAILNPQLFLLALQGSP
jgi:hypothetical protein